MGRLVLAGTAQALVTPTQKQLALPDWNESYLEWVDLSGLTIPPMEDADVRHYKATGATFQGSDYTQFRFPIDLTGAKFPSDFSSYNHDFTAEIARRSLKVPGPVGKLARIIYNRVNDGTYANSWQDTYWACMQAFTLEEVHTYTSVVFAGFKRLLSRLTTTRDIGPQPDPPPMLDLTRTPHFRGNEKLTFDFSAMEKLTDRFRLRERLRTSLMLGTGLTDVDVWVATMEPEPVVFIKGDETDKEDWWKSRWGK